LKTYNETSFTGSFSIKSVLETKQRKNKAQKLTNKSQQNMYALSKMMSSLLSALKTISRVTTTQEERY